MPRTDTNQPCLTIAVQSSNWTTCSASRESRSTSRRSLWPLLAPPPSSAWAAPSSAARREVSSFHPPLRLHRQQPAVFCKPAAHHLSGSPRRPRWHRASQPRRPPPAMRVCRSAQAPCSSTSTPPRKHVPKSRARGRARGLRTGHANDGSTRRRGDNARRAAVPRRRAPAPPAGSRRLRLLGHVPRRGAAAGAHRRGLRRPRRHRHPPLPRPGAPCPPGGRRRNGLDDSEGEGEGEWGVTWTATWSATRAATRIQMAIPARTLARRLGRRLGC